MPLVGHNPLRLSAMDKAAWDRAASADEIAVMQDLLRAAMDAGAWGWSTTDSPTHAGPHGEPVPTRLAADEERVALGRALGEVNRGVIEILPKGAAQPTEADHAHLADVAWASGRPVFFLTFDAAPRARVEASTREGAQMYALLRAIPFNPRFTLKKTTFFSNLDVWDVTLAKPLEERLAALADPAKRAELREWADKRQRRRPGVPGRFIKWQAIVVKKTALEKNRALEGRAQSIHPPEEAPASPPVCGRGEAQILEHRQLGKEVGALEGAGDAAPGDRVRRQACDEPALEEHVPGAGRHLACDDVEERGLARAVRTDEPEHLTGRDREVDLRDRVDSAESP